MTLRHLALVGVPLYFALGEPLTRVSVGPVSLNAIVTLALVTVLLALVPILARHHSTLPPAFGLLTLWLAVAFARTIIGPRPGGGTSDHLLAIQQFLAWVLFVGSILGGAWLSSRRASYRSLPGALVTIGSIWGVAAIALKPVSYEIGGFQLLGPRPVAAILLIAFSLAYGRFFTRRRLGTGLIATLLLLSLVVSESRSATAGAAIAILAIETSRVRLARPLTWRGFVYAGALTASAAGLAWSYAPFRERVKPLVQSPRTVLARGAATAVVATQGRSAAWPQILAHALEAPMVGHGIGTASSFTYEVTRNERFAHPHNEYLRFLHDAGMLGLFAWVMGFVHAWVVARRTHRSLDKGVPWGQRAAAVGLVGLIPGYMMLFATDNVGFYTFVVVPFGTLIGLVLAAGRRRSQEGRVLLGMTSA